MSFFDFSLKQNKFSSLYSSASKRITYALVFLCNISKDLMKKIVVAEC